MVFLSELTWNFMLKKMEATQKGNIKQKLSVCKNYKNFFIQLKQSLNTAIFQQKSEFCELFWETIFFSTSIDEFVRMDPDN